MSIVKVKSSKSAGANLHYVFDGQAHNNQITNHRYLGASGHNILLDYNGDYDSSFLASQYSAVRRHAKNPNKTVQDYHMITSFSKDEFDGSSLEEQSQQALSLVNGALDKRLPAGSQYVTVAQIDGDSGMLHCHTVINSVKTDGKVLNTNDLSVTGQNNLRNYMDDYLADNFEPTTGRHYEPINHLQDHGDIQKSGEVVGDKDGKYIWKNDLKARIIDSFEKADDMVSFETQLLAHGVSVKHRKAGTGEKNSDGTKVKRDALTYSFDDANGKHRQARDYAFTKSGQERGLGLDYTPDSIQKELEAQNQNQVLMDDEDEEEEQFKLKQREIDINGFRESEEQISNVDDELGESDEELEQLGKIQFGQFDISQTTTRISQKRQRTQGQLHQQTGQRERDEKHRSISSGKSSKSLRRLERERPAADKSKQHDYREPSSSSSKSNQNQPATSPVKKRDGGLEL